MYILYVFYCVCLLVSPCMYIYRALEIALCILAQRLCVSTAAAHPPEAWALNGTHFVSL